MDYYKPGDWLVTCDSCGKKMKATHTKHRWDGFIVCDSCWEPRHSHDFIKVKYDKQEVPFSRRPQEIFTDVPYIVPLSCTPLSRLPQADFGTADCAIVNTPNTVIDIGDVESVYIAAVAEHRGGSSTFLAYDIANTGESTWPSYFGEFGSGAVLGWDETAGTADTGAIPVSPVTLPFDPTLDHTLQCYSGSSTSSDAKADIEFLDDSNNVIAAIRVNHDYIGTYGSQIEIGASLITLGAPSKGFVAVYGRIEFTGTGIDFVNEYPAAGGAAGVSYPCDTTLITQVRMSNVRATEVTGLGTAVAVVIFQRRLP